MKWLCGALSFLWFCSDSALISQTDFDRQVEFFSHLDIVLSNPKRVCSALAGEKKLEFQGLAHLAHDEHLAEIKKIDLEMFKTKMTTCYNDCTCGALLTLEDKVEDLPNDQSKILRERQEQLTSEYYEACQEKIQLDCGSKVVTETLGKDES